MIASESKIMEKNYKLFAAVSFTGLVLWQIYLAFFSYTETPILFELYQKLDLNLPLATIAQLSASNWLFIVPLLSALVAIFAMLRLNAKTILPLIFFAMLFLVTFVMQFFVIEGLFAPINNMNATG